MSDLEDNVENVETVLEPEVKPKRKLTEKQLENLKKAREKARISIQAKKKRKDDLKANEKKLKEMKMKEKELKIQAEMNLMKLEPVEEADDELTPKAVRKKKPLKKTKKRRKIVYVSASDDSSSDESDGSEEEIVYKKKPKPKSKPPRVPKKKVVPTMKDVEQDAEKAAIQQRYNNEVLRMKRQFLMEQIFPSG